MVSVTWQATGCAQPHEACGSRRRGWCERPACRRSRPDACRWRRWPRGSERALCAASKGRSQCGGALCSHAAPRDPGQPLPSVSSFSALQCVSQFLSRGLVKLFATWTCHDAPRGFFVTSALQEHCCILGQHVDVDWCWWLELERPGWRHGQDGVKGASEAMPTEHDDDDHDG